ncbi:MAG TPA: IclR family transcriptional regulator [Chloroflexota bacterium]|nr:IclR family transcriptional regulator [Chloroflexota bacterium]
MRNGVANGATHALVQSAERRTPQSVDRACALLDFLLRCAERGASLTEVAAALDVHKSTGLRLLTSFETASLVMRSPASGRYQLGLGLVALAGSVLGHLPILRIADPQLRRLAEDTRRTVNLAVRHRDQILNVDQISSPDVQRSPDWLGRRAPLHKGAAAKALLAHLESAESEGYLTALESTEFAPAAAALRIDLAEIRTRGFAINHGEVDPQVTAIGAPIFDASGSCLASISIAWYDGDNEGAVQQRLDELARPLLQTARTISRQLGYTSRHNILLA